MVGRVRRLPWGTLSWLPFLAFAFGPAAFLLISSFRPDGQWTLDAYERAWFDEGRLMLLANSMSVGLGVVGLCLLIGVPFGFLVGRSDLRLRGIYQALALVPLLIPPYVAGIAWTELLTFGGYWAIVLLLSATFLPIVVLLSARGFREVDRDSEDAARLARGDWGAFWRVSLPLCAPSLVTASLLVFVLSIMDFIVADFFSFAVESNYQVFAMDVYAKWATLNDEAMALASAAPLMVLGALGMLWIAWLEGRRSHASKRGESPPPRPFALGRAQVAAHLFLLTVLGLSAFVPLGVLGQWVWESAGATAVEPPADAVVPVFSVTQEPVTPLSVLRGPARPDLIRSVLYCGLAALGVLLISVGPGLRLARRGGSAAMALALMPLAFPSLFLGIAQIRLFNREGLDAVYDGGALVVFTLMGRYAPLGVLAIRAAWRRIDPAVEDAARLCLPGGRRWFRVILPLLGAGLSAAFVLSLCLALRDLDSIVLLNGAQETLALRLYSKIHYARDAEVAVLSMLQVGLVLLPWMVWRLLSPADARRA